MVLHGKKCDPLKSTKCQKKIEKLTPEQLRNLLASHNLDTSVTKPSLVSRLKFYFLSRPEDSVPLKKIQKIDILSENCTVDKLKELILDRGGKIRAGSRKSDLLTLIVLGQGYDNPARIVPTTAKCHNLVWDGQIFKLFFLDYS